MPRTRIVLVLATMLALAGVSLMGWGVFGGEGAAGVLPAGLSPAPRAATPTVDPAELARQQARLEREKREKALTAALDRYAATAPDFALAVVDNTTGESYSYGGTRKYETASVIKVDILAALLLDAQDEERELTRTELSLARNMIRVSDNEATTALFGRIGRTKGLTSANKRLGLKQTVVNSSWGLTRTTVEDQTRLLAALVDEDGPLDADSRKLALDLMGSVATDQRWGVSAAAKGAEKAEVKNGWLPRGTENGRWIINSVGRVAGDDVDVSIAVLSHGHTSFDGGIDRVERVVQMTRQYLKW